LIKQCHELGSVILGLTNQALHIRPELNPEAWIPALLRKSR
jgi:hypothetical protein